MKNAYIIEDEKIIFRRAKYTDNFIEIAELIYKTDPYIYPFWFKNDMEEAIEILSKKIGEKGFIFYYENIYVAYDKTINKIIGIICALDRTTDLNYDYSYLENINRNYNFTINNYIKPIIKETLENNYLYISNVCISGDYRGKKVGTHLLGYFIRQMEKTGFELFALDCLLHNLRAKKFIS